MYISILVRERMTKWSNLLDQECKIWEILKLTPTLPDSPSFPPLPNAPEVVVNLMITLINQANFLIDKLLISLNEKHMKEGGFNERLYRKRVEYRIKNP